MRSHVTIDLGALRRNVQTLVRILGGAELWAVVKGDGYGHGAVDCAGAALAGGATALCVATVGEAVELRTALPDARVLVLGPSRGADLALAREARLELVAGRGEIPLDVPVHMKLDTGMGRWGLSELAAPGSNVVGVMTHLATADLDLDFARIQVERFRAATEQWSHLTRHAANSAAALRLPESRFDAVRCGIAISDFHRSARMPRPTASSRYSAGRARSLKRAFCARGGRPDTVAGSSQRAIRGSASCRSGTPTVSGGASPEPISSSARSGARSSAPFRWTLSRSSFPVNARRERP